MNTSLTARLSPSTADAKPLATVTPLFILLLGALTMLGPLSIDISLPGLPRIALELSASARATQWTLSAFVAAFGSGQLVIGALSDRYGRRRTLLGGLAVFTLSAAACACTTDIRTLIVLRAIQGFAACAGSISARAIVADVARDGLRATSLQAYVSAINALAPILAPLLGAVVLSAFGWRWLYGSVAIAGSLLLLATLAKLHETSQPTRTNVLATYRRMLTQPQTLPLAAYMACAFAAFFAMISGSPMVLQSQLQVSSGTFAIDFALSASAALAGSFAARRLAHLGARRLLPGGAGLLLLTSMAGLAIDVLHPSAAAFTAAMACCAFCFGLTVPAVYALGLADAGRDAGVGAALLGASQMIGGSAGSALAATLPWAPATAVGAVVVSAAVCATAAALAVFKGEGSSMASQLA